MGRPTLLLPLLALATALTGACSPKTRTLLVDVRTDLVPGAEFVTLVTERFAALPGPNDAAATEDVRERFVSLGEDSVDGIRAAEYLDVGGGEHALRVRLLDLDGNLVHERVALVTVRGSTVVTIVVSRSCRNVACPSAGAEADATACLGGTCVHPSCVPEAPDLCPGSIANSDCAEGSTCTFAAACAVPKCVAGLCLASVRDCGNDGYCDPDIGCVPFDPVEDAGVTMDAATATDTGVGDAARGDAGAPSDGAADAP